MPLPQGITRCKIVTPSVIFFAFAFLSSGPLVHQYVYKHEFDRRNATNGNATSLADETRSYTETDTADLNSKMVPFFNPQKNSSLNSNVELSRFDLASLYSNVTTTVKPRLLPCNRDPSSQAYKDQMRAQARTSYILLINTFCGTIPVSHGSGMIPREYNGCPPNFF